MTDAHDLYFAAFLVASGVPLLRTERDARGLMVWHFDPSSTQAFEDARLAWKSLGRIAARSYADAVKMLKSDRANT